MNEENLIPMNQRSDEEKRTIAQQGGIASGEMRRQRKQIATVVLDILSERASAGSDVTKLEAIARKTIQNLYSTNPTVGDLLELQKLIGESVLKVDVSGSNVVINITQENADKLDKI